MGPGLGVLDATAPEAAEDSAGVSKSCTAGVSGPRPEQGGVCGAPLTPRSEVSGDHGRKGEGGRPERSTSPDGPPGRWLWPHLPTHRHCITPTPQDGGTSSHSTTPQSPADLGSSPVGPADRTNDETDPERRQLCSRPTVTSPVPKPQCQGSVPACITHRS